MAEAELPEQLQLVLEASETSLDPKYVHPHVVDDVDEPESLDLPLFPFPLPFDEWTDPIIRNISDRIIKNFGTSL